MTDNQRDQKRRRLQDSDDHHGGGHRDRDRNQDRRPREISNRLRNLIERLGEQSKSSVQDNIHGVASVLLNDMSDFKEQICKTIVSCAARKPDRTAVYSTLVGLINAESFETGSELIKQLMDHLSLALKDFAFVEAASLIRFASDLANASVLQPGPLVALLQNLADVTKESNIPQSRSDVYAHMVLGVMPWVGRDLAERSTEALNDVIKTLSEYMDNRRTDHVSMLSVYTQGADANASQGTPVPPQVDTLQLLWAQVSSLQRRDWKESTVLRPYIYFDEILVKSQQHVLPSCTIPRHVPNAEANDSTSDGVYPFPSVSFRLFGKRDAVEDLALPPSRAVERYLYETFIRETLYSFYPDVPLAARQLSEIVFNNRRIPYKYVIVEVLLGEIFRLPRPRVSLLYYFSVISELVRLIQVSFVEVLLVGLDLLFHRMHTMEIECRARCSQWVAFFLNNFEFKFRWKDWFDVVTADADSPQAVFVTETLSAMIRFSYYEHISKEIQLPPQLLPFLPPAPEATFKFSSITDDARTALCIDDITASVRSRNTKVADVKAVLERVKIPETMTMEDGADQEEQIGELRIEVLMSCILNVGSKTIHHLDTILKRNTTILNEICESPEARSLIVTTTASFWQKNPQMMIIAMEKLLSFHIVDAATVLEWVFCPTTSDLFIHHYIWDILFNTLDICELEVKQSLSSIRKLKAQMEKDDGESNEGNGTSEEDLEAKMKTVLEELERKEQTQKDAILMVFQLLSAILNERLAQNEHHWISVSIGRFLQIGRKYNRMLRETGVLSSVIDAIGSDMHAEVGVVLEKIKILTEL